MELNPEVAKTIVNSLKDTIDHEINLFDTNGVIIASTDKKRVGTIHAGAKEVLKTNEINIITEDDEKNGVRPGINLPILFNNTTIAIIGITGNPAEIESFGTIIKKMTEILIRENWLQINLFNNRNNIDHLVSMLISDKQDEELIASLASMIHINLESSCYVVVGNVPRDKWLIYSNENFQRSLDLFLAPHGISLYTITNREICLLLEADKTSNISRILTEFQAFTEESFHTSFVIGVSSLAENYQEIAVRYKEAQRALNWGEFKRQDSIYYYSELEPESKLVTLPTPNMVSFVQKILGNLTTEKKEEFRKLLLAYRDANGSISQGAQELFIHKNTFQNKLNKFHQLTGYNPRELKDFALIDIAYELDGYLAFLKE